MNVKIIALTTTGALATTGATLGYYLLRSKASTPAPNPTRIPSGKTLQTRYPSLTIPPYPARVDGEYYDNTFWLNKAEILKKSYLSKADIKQALFASMKKESEGKYNFQEGFFELNGSNRFNVGESLVAEALAKYCSIKSNSEEETIPDFPEVMKNLCTE